VPSRVSFGRILVEYSCISNCETGILGIAGSGYLSYSEWQKDLNLVHYLSLPLSIEVTLETFSSLTVSYGYIVSGNNNKT